MILLLLLKLCRLWVECWRNHPVKLKGGLRNDYLNQVWPRLNREGNMGKGISLLIAWWKRFLCQFGKGRDRGWAGLGGGMRAGNGRKAVAITSYCVGCLVFLGSASAECTGAVWELSHRTKKRRRWGHPSLQLPEATWDGWGHACLRAAAQPISPLFSCPSQPAFWMGRKRSLPWEEWT